MCALHATHSSRQIPCNPVRDHLNNYLLDNWLKSLNWNLAWQITGNSAEDSPLPLSCIFASQLAWTHPHAQGTPAAAEGKAKPGETSATAALTLSMWQGAVRQQKLDPTRTLARYSSATSSCPHDFLMWLFPPYPWDPEQTSSNFPQAGGQWGKETNHETHKGQQASPSRPLWPGLSTQSLTSAEVWSVRAEGKFFCPYSSNSSSEIFSLGNYCLWLWHKAALPAGERH